MFRYFKFIIFYFLAIIDSVVNFLGSLLHFYPKLELATIFLVWRELKAINKVREFRSKEKYEQQKRWEDEVLKLKKESKNSNGEKT